MPTFHDPTADAAEASDALRGLAHASRMFDQPADTYPVFGDLLAGVRSLRQVLDQLANAHLTHRDRAHDDEGNHRAGAQSALAAADELHQTGTLLDHVASRLDAAFSHSGRIAWHHEPTPPGPVTNEPPAQWVSVVFLQGDEADAVLDLIDRDGADAAIAYLQGWDYGDETTGAALVNGDIYDEPPTGPLDRVITDGAYTLTYNPTMGHASLLRQHTTSLDEPDAASPREPATRIGAAARAPRRGAPASGTAHSRPADDSSWFEYPGGAAGNPSRGHSL